MDRLAYVYILVTCLCEEGKDYLDCFRPFVLWVMPRKKLSGTEHIQRALTEVYGLTIPLHTINAILYRLEQQKFVERSYNEYTVTERGVEYVDSLEAEESVERRINELLDDIKAFLREKEPSNSPTVEEIRSSLFSLLNNNTDFLAESFSYIGAAVKETPTRPIHLSGLQTNLIAYIELAAERKPGCYNTLADLLFGSIVSLVINTQDTSKLVRLRSKKFKGTTAFLDTNYVFSYLGLHPVQRQRPAVELMNLMKSNGFKTCVFGFTVEEICRVVSGYLSEESIYPKTIEIDSVYSTLKRLGWTRADVHIFIINLEKNLREKGVEIEWTREINLNNYVPLNGQSREVIEQYKSDQDTFHQNHDFAAIDKVLELRHHPITNIENARYIFVTSDRKLARYDFRELGHRGTSTVCEVILDSLLTTILWLKNTNSKVSLHSLIAAFSGGLFVSRSVWKTFYNRLREMKASGKVMDDAISALFYHNYIGNVLRKVEDTELDGITDDFVLTHIEEANRLRDREFEDRERELIRRLEEKQTEIQANRDKHWLDKIASIKANLGTSSDRTANRVSTVIASSATAGIVAAVVNLQIRMADMVPAAIYYFIASVVLGAGGTFAIWKKLKGAIQKRLSNWIYNRKLREIHLAD